MNLNRLLDNQDELRQDQLDGFASRDGLLFLVQNFWKVNSAQWTPEQFSAEMGLEGGKMITDTMILRFIICETLFTRNPLSGAMDYNYFCSFSKKIIDPLHGAIVLELREVWDDLFSTPITELYDQWVKVMDEL